MNVHMEFYQPDEIPATLNAEIKRWYRQVFPQVDETGMANDGTVYASGPYRVLAWHDGAWSGIVEILPRDIRVGGQTIAVGGVGGVMVLPEKRGLGIGQQLMRRTIEVICGQLALPVGLLFCGAHMLPYYGALGWQERPDTLVYQQAGTAYKLAADMHYMVYPCEGQTFPAGDVDVRGTLW